MTRISKQPMAVALETGKRMRQGALVQSSVGQKAREGKQESKGNTKCYVSTAPFETASHSFLSSPKNSFVVFSIAGSTAKPRKCEATPTTCMPT